MRKNREQKIFSTVLWIYLIGSLIFFIYFLSIDRIFLPTPAWLTFLLLDIGFIIFLFVPQPGRRAAGPRDRAPEQRWYPQTLADIVDGIPERKAHGRRGLRAVITTIEPVPLVPLVLLLLLIILASPVKPDERAWSAMETDRLQKTYEKAGREFGRLEAIVTDLGERATELLRSADLEGLTHDERAMLIHRIDSLAGTVRAVSVPFNEIGIQAFGPRGTRIAWGGMPRYMEENFVRSQELKVFTAKTQLYTLLVCSLPLAGGGSVVVDTPLEVNYLISNQYLQSTGLGEILSVRFGDEIDFSFSMGRHRGEFRFADENLEESEALVRYVEGEGVKVYGIVTSSAALPLAGLRVLGDPFSAVLGERESRRTFWAGLDTVLIFMVIAFWVHKRYGKKRRRARGRRWHFLKRLLIFIFFLGIVRYLFLELDIPRGFFGTDLFDPALFADADVPGGFLQTTGDFLVTALFALILVFGAVKIFRTYYSGHMEQALTRGDRFRVILFIAKTVLIGAVVAGSIELSRNIVSRVVLNSNPRLIGLDVAFFDLPVLALHLAMLFAISAIFIAALFLCRLLLVWGDGEVREGVAAAATALVVIVLLLKFPWILLPAAAGLLTLSMKIFPLLKKEEVISVVVASFFLVLICSLVIYGAAAERYTDLNKSRVIEKAQSFNYPEDSWLQLVLPELCQQISQDRTVASKVASRKQATAFETWAESALSRYSLSCAFDVYDSMGRAFSCFSVGMPFEHATGDRDAAKQRRDVDVDRIEQETRVGTVRSFRGLAPLHDIYGKPIGRVEITIPYFFENTELLARTGRMAPEILHNVEPGALAPRVDEPENQLVAQVSGNRIVDSSTPLLLTGNVLPVTGDEWFALDLGRERYQCIVKLRNDGEGFLIGYRTAGLLEGLLRWATIVSLDLMLTVGSLFIVLFIRKFPVIGRLIPAISLTGAMSFRQKILLSFLAVSVVPVVILGIFSGQYIRGRFREEGEKKALAGVSSAVSLLDHSIRSEAESFAGSQYLSDILGGVTDARIRDVALQEVTTFTLFDRTGNVLLDEGLSDFSPEDVELLLNGKDAGGVTFTYEPPDLYGGVVIPLTLPDGPGGHLYYRRRMDDEFVRGISDVLGEDISIYYQGLVEASSDRGLFVGGFLNPLLAPPVFADIALRRGKALVLDESLGNYSYQVASAPLARLGGGESGVLSVPLLYQPALVQKEVMKTSSLMLGLLALIFAATVTLGVFLAGKIFTPIAVLSGGTRRIIQGDLEFRLEAKAPDEIGELVESFNTMTGALRAARHDLMERQRYLTAVLDNIAAGVIAVGSDGRIMTINPSGERILRVSKTDVMGRKPGEVADSGLEPLFELFSESTDRVREREVTLSPGGERRTIKAVVTDLSVGEEKLGTVVVFDDLTELIRSKKLAAWIEMARQIAHEVKNPLTPIRLSTQLMQRAYREKSERFGEIFESGVETVIQQTDILRRIASEFSSFGRVTSLKLEKVPLNDFIGDFLSSYRGAEGVEIHFEPAVDAAVKADGEALRKVLLNLMVNAFEAMPDGGRIDVFCKRVDDMAEIHVVDTGPGLPPDIEERLFEPYFSTKTTGTGLGLAICQNLAREMDGEVRLRNREDRRGVEAIVALPLAD